MAYNYNRTNREWDQGKSYGYEGGMSRVRPREDEYNDYNPGGEKRRKYDGGVRQLQSLL